MSASNVVREAQSVETYEATAKQKAAAKLSRIPIKVEPGEVLKKPDWIRVKAGSATTRFYEIKQILREQKLHTVCEEASCPNIGECFGKGTATFMIMGDKCTRRCPVLRRGPRPPDPLDAEEPQNLAQDDRRAQAQVRGDHQRRPRRPARRRRRPLRGVHPQDPRAVAATRIEVLVPDFRGRDDRALEILKAAPPDVMNHNLETMPRLYKEARPGSDYQFSLNLLKKFKAMFPQHPDQERPDGRSGRDRRGDPGGHARHARARHRDAHHRQYLAPTTSHLPVRRYVHPDTFKMFEQKAHEMGFTHAAVGAMVRSSYHADQQAHAAGVPVGD